MTTGALGPNTAEDDNTKDASAPTVLLFDDDDITLLALHALLERIDANIIECEHERCVIDSCEQKAKRIDLLVSDVILPVSNGPAVVRKVKPLQPRMRLLFISGFSLGELNRRGLLSKNDLCPGDTEFLQKPFPPDEFIATVKKLLNPSAP